MTSSGMFYENLLDLLNSIHRAKVLVLGDVMLDRFVYGSVERISPEAPIPIMLIERVIDMPGGAANVARSIAAIGAQAILIGVIGSDTWAEDLRRQIALTPAIDARLVEDQSRATTLKTRYVAERQQILRADRESRAVLGPSIESVVMAEYRQALSNVDVVVLSDYAKGVLSDSVTQEAIMVARSAGKPVVVDPKSKSFKKYAGATILTPNRQELQLACGLECKTDEQVERGALQLLRASVCESMVVTRSADGMSVITAAGSVTHLRTAAREVFDVSGAGDTVIAALSAGLAVNGNLVDVAKLANLAAGVVVGKQGTAVVTAGEIIASLDSSAELGTPEKIFTLARVQQNVQGWRDKGLKIAFTNGCFDLLHPGHISLLNQARDTADKLIVGLNADISVRRLKGSGRPVQSEVARATVLSSLKSVDAVVIFAEDTPLNLIETLKPDVLVKGADYTEATVVGAEFVVGNGGRVVLARLVDGQSTTNTLRRVTSAEKS